MTYFKFRMHSDELLMLQYNVKPLVTAICYNSSGNFFFINFKAKVSLTDNYLVVQCEAPAMNLNLYGFLCCLEIQYR